MTEIIQVHNPSLQYKSLEICSPKVSQLYLKGKVTQVLDDDFENLRVGIVGTRDATQAGLADARRIAQVVASAGGVVVSGMALGIDGAAHQGAIDVDGKTIAVLGSGVDVIYPMRHFKLAEQIEDHGCIISEFDCGTKALPWHFPVRNRIIAALCNVIVVPEGTLRGGARITVDLALAMGKTVCAIPGPRRNRASELPNSIIKDGATCITDPSDVLRELGIDADDSGWQLQSTEQSIIDMPANDNIRKIIAELAHQPMTCLDIAHICKYSEKEALRILATIEHSGQIRFKRGLYELVK